MSTSISIFCEYCGAANETQATNCCFCGNPLQASQAAGYDEESGGLLANTLLKGRYRIIKAIGQGGMGTVYRAQDTELNNRSVAVKEMNVQSLSTQQAQEAMEAFKREATLLAELQHPNLPSVFEHFEEDGRWYMIMSFIQGETLENYLERTKRTKLPLAEVLSISKQLCTVLYYLHSQQPSIIFRDVKPANIMRTPDGRIYLIDFGVARRFKPGQPKDTTPFGSIGYAPPEQFNKAQTTPRSDIYSLGATLYQLLTGHEPDSEPFRFPPLQSLEPDVPVQLATLIEQMLDMDEKRRPASMLIVEQNLQKISASAAVFQPFTHPKPTTQRKRISPFILAMLVLSLCCIGIGGFIGAGISSATTNARAMSIAQQIAARPNPYSPKGTLALVDPLNHIGAWQPQPLNQNYGTQCQFVNGSFQVQIASPGFNNCNESAIFRNFVIQVNMTIAQGLCGGLVLREDTVSMGMYDLYVCSDGSYTIVRYVPVPGAWKPETLLYGNSDVIHQGPSQNIVAAVANGNNFALYVNDVKIARFVDDLFSAGSVGLIASGDNGSPATVDYQDAIIWVLP